MGIDFSLACNTCKEFISLHKWSIVASVGELLADAPYDTQKGEYDSSLTPSSVPLNRADIVKSIETECPEQSWIHDLVPYVLQFAEQHNDHELLLFSDWHDMPWEFGGELERWKKLELPVSGYSTSYLPRNLIEVHHLSTWEDVEDFLQKEHPWLLHEQLLEELHNIKSGYLHLMQNKKSQQENPE